MFGIRIPVLLMGVLAVRGLEERVTEQGMTIRFPEEAERAHCSDVFDHEQQVQENATYHEHARGLQWVDTDTTHMVRAIIEFINHKEEAFLTIVRHSVRATLRHTAPLILMALLFCVLACCWFYRVVVAPSTALQSKRSTLYGRLTVSHIGTVGCVLSIALLAWVCVHGIQGAPKIRRTINTMTCTLTRQKQIGVIVGPNGWASGGPLEFAQQIDEFQSRTRDAIKGVQPLYESEKLAALARKSEAMVHAWGQESRDSMFIKDLNATATQLKHVVRVLRDFPLKLRTFNDTIEYVRQIMYGLRLIIGNVDKFFSRYVGFDSLSSACARLAVTILVVIGSVAVGSVGVIVFAQLMGGHQYGHLRYGAQYLLGLCFVVALILAVTNSVLVPFLYSHHGYLNYLMSSPERMKGEFKVGRYINRYLQEIITHFFSNAEGSIWHYYDGKLLAELEYLEHAFVTINSQHFALLQVQAEGHFGEKGQSEAAELAQLGKILDQDFESQVRTAERGVRELIYELRDPGGSLGKLRTMAVGEHYIYPLLNNLRINVMSRFCQYRFVFGWSAFALLTCLICSCLVEEGPARDRKLKVEAEAEEDSRRLMEGSGEVGGPPSQE